MEQRVISGQLANVLTGDMLHQFIQINTFETRMPFRREEFTPVWHPPKILKDFTGREKDLAALEAFLAARHDTVVIIPTTKVSGTGGIGKTQLAIEFFHRQQRSRNYDVMLWFNNDLSSEFRTLAHSLGFEVRGVSDAEIARRIYIELSKRGRVLIVMDDASRQEYFEHYAPPSYLDISVLLTTRDGTNWGANVHSHMLGVFMIDESKEYIRKVFENNGIHYDEQEAENLAETIGNFPLALSQAVAYIVKHRCSIPDYIERFKSKTKLSLSTRFENDPYRQYVWVTVNLSLEKIEQEESRAILDACSYLAPEAAILEELIKCYLSELSINSDENEERDSVTPKILDVKQYLQELSSLSLIDTNDQLESFTMHQIVQDVLKIEKTTEIAQLMLITWAVLIETWTDSLIRHFKKYEDCVVQLKPHTMVLANQLSVQPRIDRYLARQGHMHAFIASACQAKGLDKQVKEQFENQLACLEKMSKPNKIAITVCNVELSGAIRNCGDPFEARKRLGEELQILKRSLDADHISIGMCLVNLSGALNECGDWFGARDSLSEALSILKDTIGESDPQYSIALVNLGMVLTLCGDPLAARSHLLDALPILKNSLGKDHEYVGNCLMNLGVALLYCRDFTGAENHLLAALSILKGALGERHKNIGVCLMSLGGVLQCLGKRASAKDHFLEALSILKDTMRGRHPFVGYCMMNLGVVLQSSGDVISGREYMLQALDILSDTLGKSHVNVGKCLMSLGGALLACGDRDGAKERLHKALPILKESLGNQHAAYGLCLLFLGTSLRVKDPESATNNLSEALPILEVFLGTQHPHYALCLSYLGGALFDCGDSSNSRGHLSKALPTLNKTLGQRHVEVGFCLSNLGGALLDCGDPVSAIEKLDEALPILKEAKGERDPNFGKTLMNLGTALYTCGEPFKAKEHFSKALDIFKETSDKFDANIGRCLMNFGMAMWASGENSQGKALLRQALPILKMALSDRHSDFINCQMTLNFPDGWFELQYKIKTSRFSTLYRRYNISRTNGFFSPNNRIVEIPSPRPNDLDEILEQTLSELEFENTLETDSPPNADESILEKILDDVLEELDKDELVGRHYRY